MARINLLPWRQEERERKNKEFGIQLAGAGILAILAALLAYSLFNHILSNQQQANEAITAENARLDGILTEISELEQQKEEMLSRMEVIQNLQGLRSVPVRVWDDIARAIPASVYLVGIKREGNVITLSGYADNTRVVSDLIRNLDATEWLKDSFVPSVTDSNVQAYQSQAVRQRGGGNGQEQRPVYPEDSYIQFTVVTHVRNEKPSAEEQTQAVNTEQEVPAVENQTSAEEAPAVQEGVQPAAVPAQDANSNAPANEAQSEPVEQQSAPVQEAPATATTEPAPTGGQS